MGRGWKNFLGKIRVFLRFRKWGFRKGVLLLGYKIGFLLFFLRQILTKKEYKRHPVILKSRIDKTNNK